MVRARRITDAMIAAAADAVAAFADPTGPGAALLPPVTDLRTVSAAVAIAVAQAAEDHGLANSHSPTPSSRSTKPCGAPSIHPSNQSDLGNSSLLARSTAQP